MYTGKSRKILSSYLSNSWFFFEDINILLKNLLSLAHRWRKIPLTIWSWFIVEYDNKVYTVMTNN